ncbi:MAG: hypothetical protein HY505_03265 [Candidatus Yanofskybacteria bacterium]|nr:hypothetical protein [Candidatus Yanofskybacteria bacterium]
MNYKKLRNIFNSTLTAQIVFVTVIVGAVFIFDRFYGKELSVFKNVSKNEAALFIDFDNMKKVFAGKVVEGMTILDALNAAVTAGQIELTYHVNIDNNTKVAKINNHEANGDTQFVFYINSRKLDPSELNKTQIKSGDKITIKLE